MTVHARVKNGRLLVDEPTDLPEGTELVLVAAGEEPRAGEFTMERVRSQQQAWDEWVRRGPDGPIEDDGEPEFP